MKISKKSFIWDSSELESRLDPIYYSGEIYGFIKKLNFELLKVKSLTKNITSGTGAGKQDQTSQLNGILQIRPTNIDKYSQLVFDKNIYIPNFEGIKLLKRGDVLFNNTNSQELVGKTSFFDIDEEMTFSNHITKIEVDTDIIEAKYLYLVLNIYQEHKIFYNLCTNWNNQSGVGIALLKNLKIPIPPKEIQTQIIDIMDNAYKIKKANENRAKALLDSIDTYLLDKLDICLPKEEKVVSFEVDSSEVFGNRIDPEHKIKMNNLENLKGHYPFIALKHLMVGSAQYGANETAKEALLETNVRYIRITDIDDMGRLKSAKIKTADTILEQYILNYDDILFARSGSVGKCYIHKDIEKKAIFAGYLIRFRLDKSKVNPDYLFFFCHSSIYKYWVSAIERPTVQSNINSQEYKTLKIPLPPLETQKEIASHIQALRDEAKQLQEEAKKVLHSAKDEVEAIILH